MESVFKILKNISVNYNDWLLPYSFQFHLPGDSILTYKNNESKFPVKSYNEEGSISIIEHHSIQMHCINVTLNGCLLHIFCCFFLVNTNSNRDGRNK